MQRASQAGDAGLLPLVLGRVSCSCYLHFAWPESSLYSRAAARLHSAAGCTEHAAIADTLQCRRGPTLEQYVTVQLVQLLCRTTKLCWFDDDRFRGIVQDAQQLLEKGSQVRLCSRRIVLAT